MLYPACSSCYGEDPTLRHGVVFRSLSAQIILRVVAKISAICLFRATKYNKNNKFLRIQDHTLEFSYLCIYNFIAKEVYILEYVYRIHSYDKIT